jgi:hypothetical protein
LTRTEDLHRGEALAKDRKPDNGTTRGGASRAAGSRAAKGGRTRPPTRVVAQSRPWGLIAGALAVVVFAAAAIGYAVVQVDKANANKVESVDEIAGAQAYDYPAGQEHVATPVDYTESPPVGGPHDLAWADCTGTVYDVDIRHENAVHSMEHGAVWITYDPEQVSAADIETLSGLVENESSRLMSPYAGQDSPISVQSWGHQLKVDSATDERIEQFADFLTGNSEFTPEPGASCENAAFIASPLLAGDVGTPTDATGSATPTVGGEAPAAPTSATP